MIIELLNYVGVLTRVEVSSLFLDQIKVRQFENVQLRKIHDKVLQGGN